MHGARDTEGGDGGTSDGLAAGAASQEARRSRGKQAFSVVGRFAGRLLIVMSLLAFAAGGGWLVTRAATPPPSETTSTIPGLRITAAQVEPGTAVPARAVVPAGGRAPAGDPDKSSGQPEEGSARRSDAAQSDGEQTNGWTLREWAEAAEPVVGVPARALMAYGRAALAMRRTQPGCGLSWATLAAIGKIESNHGRYGGAELLPSGYPSEPIIGVRLDGSPGVAAISDTDNGALDGDPVYDHAVGPMQFIPSTWARWASDGNGDGRSDPQQIDDAALAAARYLCAGDRNMSTAQGWWEGVLSYNHSISYAKKVFSVAQTYAERARALHS